MKKLIGIFGIAIMLTMAGTAQEFSLTETEKSYREAYKILRAGMDAFGGQTKLESIQNVSFRYEGHHTAVLQNTRPDFTKNKLKRSGYFVIDLQKDRICYEDKSERAGQYTGWHRYLIHADKGVNINLRHKPNQFRETSAKPLKEKVRLMLPHLILLEAARSVVTVRWLGNTDFNGKQQDLISFSPKEGGQYALFFDSKTSLLTKLEVLEAFPVYGDRTRQYIFSDYAMQGEFLLPKIRRSMLSGALLEELTYFEMVINGNPSDNAFNLPEGAIRNDDEAEREKTPETITQIARDVYTLDNVQGSDNRVLFVNFDNFVLVSGVPFGFSETVIKKIRERVPDKPIRYVIPTHHCYEHAGGLRPYIAEGITIVTTPGNKAYIEQIAAAPHTLRPDQLVGRPRAPLIEIIQNKQRTFADANHRLEVFDIGPTSHAVEMLILYFPDEKIVYQGDLLELDDDDPITAFTANEITVEFYEELLEMKLEPQTIIGTEGRTASFDDLKKAVKLRKETQQK